MYTRLERIKKDMEALQGFNATPGAGLTRFSLTEADRGARACLREAMETIGLKVREDAAGTLIGRREGIDPAAPVILIGSHFDSVRNGGHFDGPAGVVMALEIMRVLEERGIRLRHPVECVAMIEEEGGRFGAGVFGSRAMLGKVTYEDLKRNRDAEGVSMAEAFESFGFDPKRIGEAARAPGSVRAFIELHIEQGPVLEREKTDVGLVPFIVGISEFRVTVRGRPDHAGTTPMPLRKDALTAASEVIGALEGYAKEAGEGTVATVGALEVAPGAANIVPGEVRFTVDIRSGKEACIRSVRKAVEEDLLRLEETRGVRCDIEDLLDVAPVAMSPEILGIMEKHARKTGFTSKRMTSGAGHDAMIMASLAPAGLVFVPSRDGRSHCPEEWTDYEDLQKGIEVICHTIIELGGVEHEQH